MVFKKKKKKKKRHKTANIQSSIYRTTEMFRGKILAFWGINNPSGILVDGVSSPLNKVENNTAQ